MNKWSVQRSVTVNYSSAVHSLKVAEQIEKKRENALLGGGEERIQAQHKKVFQNNISTKQIQLHSSYFVC